MKILMSNRSIRFDTNMGATLAGAAARPEFLDMLKFPCGSDVFNLPDDARSMLDAIR
jgi:hypothetical protein